MIVSGAALAAMLAEQVVVDDLFLGRIILFTDK